MHLRKVVRWVSAACLALLWTVASGAQRNLAGNGGFERGMDGWMWEQWLNKPLPGGVEQDSGGTFFRMGLPGSTGARWLAREIPLESASSSGSPESAVLKSEIQNPKSPDYVFSFALKLTDVPDGAARVRLAVPDHGFLKGDDLVRLGGTRDWTTYRFAVTAAHLAGAGKVTIFFYDDRMDRGTIGIRGVSLAPGTLPLTPSAQRPAPILTGDTSRPDLSLFPLGAPVELTFEVTGLLPPIGPPTHIPGGARTEPQRTGMAVTESEQEEGSDHTTKPAYTVELPQDWGAGGRSLSLRLSIVDEHGARIREITVPVSSDSGGQWKTTIAAPHDRFGFYRVYAKLSDGTPLQALGSRPAGFLTYAVVPDPKKRVDWPDDRARFGMQGAPWDADADSVPATTRYTLHATACALMGVRWVLEGALYWSRAEPNHAGEFGPEQAKRYEQERNPGSATYHVYTLPPLFMAPDWAVIPATHIYETGTLTPEGERAWAAYCAAAAKAYIARNPDRKSRIYQITWEPVPPWGFKGTDKDLIRIYEIAYRALHQADPKAVVAGPCRGIWNNGDPQDTERLFREGLGKYLDAYLSHPYDTITPERDGMPQAIRTIRSMLQATTHRDLPMYGAEQGWPTDEDVSKEMLQAQGLLRQNLITLGEGYKFNFAFTFYDYRMEGSRTGYGYFYNLTPGVPFGPNKMAPKPIAPAWAAQSLLLDGCDSAGAIEWLGDKVLGYCFERPGVYRALALWCYGDRPREITVPTGVKQVDVYDWMGRGHTARTMMGGLRLTLGPEPVYVTGVSPTLWGTSAAHALMLRSGALTAFPGQRVEVQGNLSIPSGGGRPGTLTLESDRSWGIRPVSVPTIIGSSHSRIGFSLGLTIPAALPPGDYTPRLALRDAYGMTVAATGVRLRVVAPLAVQAVPSFGAGHTPGLSLTLANRQGTPVNGTLDIRLKELLPGAARSNAPMIDLVQDPGKSVQVPGTNRRIPFALAARGHQGLKVSFGGASLEPSRKYQVVLGIATSRGWKALQTESVDFLSAARLANPPTVDGDLAEWGAAPLVRLSALHDVIRSPQLCPRDLSAQLRYAWDERALYVSAEVSDDLFIQSHTGDGIWLGDCIQMAFDLDPAVPNSSPEAGQRRTSEITVALTPQGPQAYRHLSYSPEKLPLGPLTPAQLQLAVRRAGAGRLLYEMSIPWTTLGLAPGQTMAAGERIGVGATVNEVRTPDQRDPSALGLFGGIYPDKDPAKLGTMVLTR